MLSPTKILNDNIRARDWDSARIRILSYPWDSAFRSKQLNNATPLHLACLYRAPPDLVQMVLEANPEALFSQDSEGWTPLHVLLLYGSDEETALMLIQRGGSRAASVQSRIVGAPLHLACRHGCSTAVMRELLKASPAMATTANEYSTKPAKILWHSFSRNAENERLLNTLLENQGEVVPESESHKPMRDLVDQLALLVRASKGNKQHQHHNLIIHDVLRQTPLGDLTQYLSLVVLLYPEQTRARDDLGNLPLHNAARNPRACETRYLRRTVSMQSFSFEANARSSSIQTHEDPIDILLQSYPMAASTPNQQGLLPLHIALVDGQRTWRRGISSLVEAAPHLLLKRDAVSNLVPFQLAAASLEAEDSLEVVETILELLLACPHAMTASVAATQ